MWVPLKKGILIGRKATNEINFPDDQHMSNCHAQISEEDGRVFILDLKTTNGTWLRLSPEGDSSEPYRLENGTIFRLGTILTFTCLQSTAEVVEKPNSNSCDVCRKADKNCLCLPCKHIYACMGCSSLRAECAICGSKVAECVKIFGC